MRCYYHHETEAVGLCRSCSRGLCPACAAEVGKALACRERCEQDVQTLLNLNQNAVQYARGTRQARFVAPSLLVLMGFMLVLLGNIGETRVPFVSWGGALIMTVGVAFWFIQMRMARGLKT